MIKGKGNHGRQKGLLLDRPDSLVFGGAGLGVGQSLGVLDNFMKVVLGFGCGLENQGTFSVGEIPYV